MNRANGLQDLVRIYIGAAIEHASELDALRALYAAAARSGCWACIFANFNVHGRQIDLAIFTETTTLIIEAKSYGQPVIGAMNGLWTQLGPFGKRQTGNAYEQALGAKNCLRDALQEVSNVQGYPNGLVAVMPTIPAGSEVTSGDFKVTVGGAEQIAQMLAKRSGAILTIQQCEALAKRLHLESISTVDSALDQRILSSERLCASYLTSFSGFYGSQAAKLIADRYDSGPLSIALTDAQSLIASASDCVLISGPSGCGKTLLAISCAMSCIEHNCLPVFASAMDFDGRLQGLLDREISLLGSRSMSSIADACRLLGRRIILFLDGYNDCRDELKIALTRSLRAFSLRFGAGLVISTQYDPSCPDLLTLKRIFVRRPSDELKLLLAKIGERGDMAASCTTLLRVARSGLEAALIGEAGWLLPPGASMFGLFDAYARSKLGRDARDGIRLLTALAGTLTERASFSISIRAFDRLADSMSIDSQVRDTLFRVELLYLRGDRVSFSHELFHAAFAAESVIRNSGSNISQIALAIKSPRFQSSRSFIVGGLEDSRIIGEVLDKTADAYLLADCHRGECGSAAHSIVKKRIETALELLVAEAQTIRFELIGEGWDGVAVAENSIPQNANDYTRYFEAIGDGLMDGQYIDVVLAASGYLDEAISSASKAFSDAAKNRNIPLRHAMFSQAYVLGRTTALSQLISFIHNGMLLRRSQPGQDFGPAIRKAWSTAKTPGQFYLLIGLTRSTEYIAEVVPYVRTLLQNIRSCPYHLQLDLLNIVLHVREAEEPYRTEMIEALNACLDKLGVMMNSLIFEALQALGALQEEELNHAEVVRREIEETLNAEGEDADRMAWGVFSCQFDHPFDSAYWDEIQQLDDVRRKIFLTKACRGATRPYLSFLGILIRQLGEFNDPATASAIAPWTMLPEQRAFMPQDAVEVFVAAHECLGYLGVDLPYMRGHVTTDAERALLACGELLYWSTRTHIKDPQTSSHTYSARSVLLDHSKCASAGALDLVTSARPWDRNTRRSIVDIYPDLAIQVCREGLNKRQAQVSYYNFGIRNNPVDIAIFCIQVLGEAGNGDDLLVLEGLCDDPDYGVTALAAIKKIETRVNFRHP
ncbi:NERD domain-containing protein [Burkholderia cepacia]|uniref:NERD domain-containing protein n=1 Tax=Burkholderia cepacia TaxID=292 RepID=UPI00075560D9|nr:NERD domain-containing protein [Burkholderia cepacia]